VVLVGDDNQVLVVPNSMLLANGFRNQTGLPTRRVQWSLAVRGSDLDAAREALRNRLLADARIQREPPPRVFVQEWGDDKRTLTVQAWTTAREAQAVQEELLEPLGLALASLRNEPEASATEKQKPVADASGSFGPPGVSPATS
jgi:small conductance mechanosensitive channel